LHTRTSKSFRPDQGHKQVDEQQQGDTAPDDGFHLILLEMLAETHIKGAPEKERDDHSNEQDVVHGDNMPLPRARR
jgi:hypothetical protein